MNSSQQQFLNKRKKASVKNSNTEAGPVPLVLFDPDSTVPHRARWGRWRFFQSSKGSNFDQRMHFNDFHGFLRFFHTVFNAKTFLSQRDHSHTVRVANAQLKKNAGPISQNSSFMLFKAVKIINSTPSKFPEVLNKRFKRIFQRCLRRFYKKSSSERQYYGSGHT
jgi:hypothetical protein